MTTCKCHGVSGSCAIKTCWKTLADIRVIGARLQEQHYQAAVEVASRKKTPSSVGGIGERQLVSANGKPAFCDDQLVYYSISPDYCLPDADLGSVGTRGR